MEIDLTQFLSVEGVLEFVTNGPNGEIVAVRAPGTGHALGAALTASTSIVATLGDEESGSMLESYFVGEARTAVGAPLVVDPVSGASRFVGLTVGRETDAEAMVATIQAAILK